MKVLFLYNPNSGRLLLKNHLWNIINIFNNADYDLTVRTTRREESISEYVKSVVGKFDLIVCSGGDGTLNQVVDGVVNSKTDIRIGYIPSGSTNDFATSINLDSSMEKNAELIVKGKERKIDLGKFNDKHFVYVAAFGMFSEVSYATNQTLKNSLGHFAYILEGAKSLNLAKSYHIEITCNNETFEDDYIFGMITNSLSIGGIYKIDKKNVTLDDGLFEVLLVKKPKTLLELGEINEFFTGLIDSCSMIKSFKTNRIILKPQEEMNWSLDGEDGGSPQEVQIDVLEKAYSIICEKDN